MWAKVEPDVNVSRLLLALRRSQLVRFSSRVVNGASADNADRHPDLDG